MGVVGDVCRKITSLTPAQIETLDSMRNIMELVADLAHAQVTVYALARNENFLVMVAQVRPNTSFVEYKPNLLGTTIPAAEEPLVWRTLTAGDHICGQREWALGMDVLEMQVYPLYDRYGSIIAAVSFEASSEEAGVEGHGILVETAYMLLTLVQQPAGGPLYRPLSARDGILIADERGQIIFTNPAASSIYKVLGVGRMVGRRTYDRQVNMRLAQKAVNSREPCETEVEAGNMVLVQRAIPVLHNGQVIRNIVIVTDVTELKKKEKELLIKSAVIQEIHHRVKNNLQTIASLLRLQARRSKTPQVKAALRESVNRILSISVVHEFLSQQDREYIDVAEVAKNILDMVIQNMLEPDFNLQTVFNGQTVILPSDQASSLALVINELIQNSVEHGFVGRREGVIGVDIRLMQEAYQIEIYDDGIGLPPEFHSQSSSSLGLQIVRTLIESDLGGKFSLYSNGGTHACITVPRIAEGG
ncbi:histidine kinase [Lucifera butyrica]|uniref:histidine kinase n=1 Tax=Lucifera butyrica TaxID=1351585 RepID=A0A498R3U2_9FIRM|nr:histidine kinase N-terminal domain-containing protein [Lucifera butyrica]VBB05829.1 histidine kinase [Lucifera butyrica]